MKEHGHSSKEETILKEVWCSLENCFTPAYIKPSLVYHKLNPGARLQHVNSRSSKHNDAATRVFQNGYVLFFLMRITRLCCDVSFTKCLRDKSLQEDWSNRCHGWKTLGQTFRGDVVKSRRLDIFCSIDSLHLLISCFFASFLRITSGWSCGRNSSSFFPARAPRKTRRRHPRTPFRIAWLSVPYIT